MNDPTQHLDAVVAVLRERLDNLAREIHGRFDAQCTQTTEFGAEVRLNHKELKHSVQALELHQREQNGNVSKALERIVLLEQALGPVVADRHDSGIRKGLLAAQIRLIGTGAGVGAGTLTVILYILGLV